MSKLIPFYFFLVFFFPLLPKVMGNSQIHINFITLVFSLVFLYIYRNRLLLKSLVIFGIYFFVMQILLFGSTYNGLKHEQLSMSALFSALRPTLLFILYITTVELCRRYKIFTTTEFKFLVLFSFIYVIFEVFFLQYSRDIITLLYKRDFRQELFFAGTTFFGTTYYSGYSFFCIFLLTFVNLYNNRRLTDKLVFLMAFFLVMISLSKTMILSLLICSYLMLLVYLKSYTIRLLVFFLPLLFVYSLFAFQNEVSQTLQDFGVPALRSINTLLYDASNSGTLSVRSEQVVDSFELGQSYGVFFGAGLGQDASIESLPAAFLYRYGIIGLIFFYICNLMLVIFSLYKLLVDGRQNFAINFALFLWLVTLPITLLSGVMIEQSKMALVSAIMLGYLFCSNPYTRRKDA